MQTKQMTEIHRFRGKILQNVLKNTTGTDVNLTVCPQDFSKGLTVNIAEN